MSRRLLACITTFFLLFGQLSFVQSAHAGMISNQSYLANNERQVLNDRILQQLSQPKAEDAMERFGVAPEDVQQRLAYLTTEELQHLADQADDLPTGEGVIGIILGVILIFLILDLLGATNVFPAVNAIN